MGCLADEAQHSQSSSNFFHPKKEVDLRSDQTFLSHARAASDKNLSVMQDRAKAGIILFLHLFEVFQSASHHCRPALAVSPVGKKAISQKFIDRAVVIFDHLFAISEPPPHHAGGLILR